jgi:hypothetical protein
MAYSNFNSPQIQQPQPNIKYIPPGKYTAIDEKFYKQKQEIAPRAGEAFGRMGRALTPFGTNVNYHATPMVPRVGGLSNGQLKLNYNSYIYNQISGFDRAHPR